MSEPAATGAPDAGKSPEPPEPKPAEQTVPYERFKEINDRLKAAEEAAAKASGALKEREEADLSELEKANKRAADAEAAKTAAEERATTLERSGWVRAAAAKARFANPENAVAMLGLAEIGSAEQAEKAVGKLAESEKHLVLPEGGPTPIGSPLLAGTADVVPTGSDGKPDHKLGLGQELAKALGAR